MNLVIDFGNTAVKVAVYKGEESLFRESCTELKSDYLSVLFRKYLIQHAIISSVSKRPDDILSVLKKKGLSVIVLGPETLLPFKNEYKTKETLGYDRIANAGGAHALFPGKNVLIVDAGTAITYDFLDSKGRFIGGNISPGFETRAKALHHFTARLPLVNLPDDYPPIGKTTEEAISAGIISGINFELEGYINNFRKKYSDLKIILTGGDAKRFDKNIKNIIFVDSNLNLYGLNHILEYNAK